MALVVCVTKTNHTMPPKKNMRPSSPADEDEAGTTLAAKKGRVVFAGDVPAVNPKPTIESQGKDPLAKQKQLAPHRARRWSPHRQLR